MRVPIEMAAYIRVLRLASTPSWADFKQIAKIAAAGIAVVGILGFAIFTSMHLLHGVIY